MYFFFVKCFSLSFSLSTSLEMVNESLRERLAELNYLYPFSSESEGLIEALLSDLVSTVTTFKELETEHEITREELRLAVDEINRVGVVENPRLVAENNALHVRVMQESATTEEKLADFRKKLHESESKSLKLELFVSQLSFDNLSLQHENGELRTRIDQLLTDEQQSVDDLHQIWLSHPPEIFDKEFFSPPSNTPDLTDDRVRELAEENGDLLSQVALLRSELEVKKSDYKIVEEKFLAQSPVTLSGNWIGFGGNQEHVIQELNDKLDFVNHKYSDLRSLHDRCGIVTDCPLVDLRQSRKELGLVRAENAHLKQQLVQLKLTKPSATKSPKRVVKTDTGCGPIEESGDREKELVAEVRTLRKANEELNRQIKQLSNELRVKEKEVRMERSSRSPVHGQDSRRLIGQVALLEEKLRQTTEDRDELIEKLGSIESAIAAMESEIVKIETENVELKREKFQKDESFVGISNQLNEVNFILNSLSSEMAPTEELERSKFQVSQLERELVKRNEEIATLQSVQRDSRRGQDSSSSSRVLDLEKQIHDLQSLTKSLAAAKEQAFAQLKSVQAELDEKRVELDRTKRESTVSSSTRSELESKIDQLSRSLRQLDAERDELQRVCDDQAEKLDVIRTSSAEARAELASVHQRLSQMQMETDKLRQMLEEKDREINRLNRLIHQLEVEVSMKDSLVATGQREVTEIAQSLANNANVARGDIDTLIDNLRITEHERNDVLSMYRQALDENKRVAAERSRMEDLARLKEAELVRAANVNQQLVRELEKLKYQSSQSVGTLDEVNDLLSIVETERMRNKDLQEHIKAISASGSSPVAEVADLQRTIEQQYILIGEMDSEQARLIVENSKLRERLQND